MFVASCVVTDKAKKKWVKFIRQQIPNLQKEEKIFISGCWAFERGAENKTFFEVYPELLEWQEQIEILPEDPDTHTTNTKNKKKSEWDNKIKKFNTSVGLYTKKFILIQWWCDSFCTFCLTVQKRGRHFFRDKDDILEEILDFERAGGKEVVLTWVNLSAWGLETTNDIEKSRFSELLEYLLKKSDIPRLRISSLWPEFIDNKVLKIFENPRIYPHFHFSLQSGSSNVLRAMKRHYDKIFLHHLLKKVRKIQRKDSVNISLWADIIVGFPWETEDDFMDTYTLIQEYWITKVHAFPFSAHKYGESVPAWFYPNQVSEKVKERRWEQILSLGNRIRKEFIASQIWKEFEVLLEVVKNEKWKGWTQNYIEVSNKNFAVTSWEIKKNEIVKWILKGIIQEKWNDDFGM